MEFIIFRWYYNNDVNNWKQNSKQTDYTFSDINLVCSIENVFINNILKHGVTVTLQILVLSFWVRIPVLHLSKPWFCRSAPVQIKELSLTIADNWSRQVRGLWNIKSVSVSGRGDLQLQVTELLNMSFKQRPHTSFICHFDSKPVDWSLTYSINGPTHWYFITQS